MNIGDIKERLGDPVAHVCTKCFNTIKPAGPMKNHYWYEHTDERADDHDKDPMRFAQPLYSEEQLEEAVATIKAREMNDES